MTARTLEEGLRRFKLVKGSVGDGKSEACAMSLASWVAGEPWSDHPECVHPWLSSMVIEAFDHSDTTEAQGVEVTRLAVEHALDTWWVPAQVLVLAAAMVPADAGPLDRITTVLHLVAQWKTEGHPVINLDGASLAGANLARANLDGASLAGANLARANLDGATLDGANLARANLAGANLARANLDGANLARANLGRANLDGAQGDRWIRLPAGWVVDESTGVIARTAELDQSKADT